MASKFSVWVLRHFGERIGNAVGLDVGKTDGTVAAGNDPRFEIAGVEKHSTTHKKGGRDKIRLDELDDPLDTNILDSTIFAHGLLPKLDGNENHYIDGTGAWSLPTNVAPHASTHTDGTDDIQNATASNKGLATAAQIAKLDGIEDLADVTDEVNIAFAIDGTTPKITPVNADKITILDSEDSYSLKTLSWLNLKNAVKTLTDTLYSAISHASTHTNGTDDIQDATASQKGLATTAQITKLNGIEALADVTDKENVGAAIAAAPIASSLAGSDSVAFATGSTLKTITFAFINAFLDTVYAHLGPVGTSNITMATAKLLGRTTAGTGAIESLSVGSTLTLSAGSLSATTGTAAGTVCSGDDSRLSDARTPTAHASTHVNGTDDIQNATASQKGLATSTQIAKLDGIESLADVTDEGNVGSSIHGSTVKTSLVDADEVPLTDSAASYPLKRITFLNLKASLKAYFDTLYSFFDGTYASLTGKPTLGTSSALDVGTTAGTVAAGDDSRLSDSRTPTAHATSHKSGGSDAIQLDELAAPTDISTLNASTSAHGLLPKLDGNASHFLDGTGGWSSPSGAGDALRSDNLDQFADVTQTSGKTLVITDNTTLNGGAVNGGTHSGTNTGDQTIALTGDVTGSGTASFAAAIAANVVTNAKLAMVPTATLKGRATAGTGNVEDLTATQVTALINNMVGDSGSGGTKGLVPAPSAGDAAANKVLGAGGTWVAVTGNPAKSTEIDFGNVSNQKSRVFTVTDTDVDPESIIIGNIAYKVPTTVVTSIWTDQIRPWRQAELPIPPGSYTSIAYNNFLYAAVDPTDTSFVVTSSDGIIWTVGTPPVGTGAWKSICYGGAGIFVAVSGGVIPPAQQVMTSPDGIDWTARDAASAADWNSVCFGNELFVAVGNNSIMTSSNGITWTSRTPPAGGDNWLSVCYGNGLFVATSLAGAHVMTSPDGITWTTRSGIGGYCVAYGDTIDGGVFISVYDTEIGRSIDGINWTSSSGVGADHYNSIYYGNNIFIAVCSSPYNASKMSSDGITWSYKSIPAPVDGIGFGNGRFTTVPYYNESSGSNSTTHPRDLDEIEMDLPSVSFAAGPGQLDILVKANEGSLHGPYVVNYKID